MTQSLLLTVYKVPLVADTEVFRLYEDSLASQSAGGQFPRLAIDRLA
jgi:hypothetical protein